MVVDASRAVLMKQFSGMMNYESSSTLAISGVSSRLKLTAPSASSIVMCGARPFNEHGDASLTATSRNNSLAFEDVGLKENANPSNVETTKWRFYGD